MTRLSQIQLWGFFSGWNKLHRSMHQPGSWLRLWRQRASKPHFPLLTSTAMAETSLTYMPFYLQKSFSVPYLSCSESCISLSAFCTSVNLASNGSVWKSSYITSPFQLGYGHSRNLSAFDYKENLYFSGCPAMKLHSCYFCFFSHHLSKQKRNSLCAVNNNKKKSIQNYSAAFVSFYFFANNMGVHSKIPNILQLLESQDSSQARSKL